MLVRALIVLLVVLNAGVTTWWIAHDPLPPAPTSAEAPGVVRLQLASEGGTPVAQRTAATPAADASGNPAAAATPARCFAFGPFASAVAAQAAANVLRPRVTRLATREQAGGTGATGWRVYLPPAADRDGALAMAQRIGAAGFDDFIVIREGADANGIALGRYRSESSARRRVDALKAGGFDARIAPLGGTTAYWIDVEASAGFDAEQARAASDAPQSQPRTCEAQR